MIVEMTSLAPKRARSHPAKAASKPPPAAPAARQSGISSGQGRSTYAPAIAAHNPPMMSCPSAPMLKSPARNATETPRPANSSVVVCASVSAMPCEEPSAPSSSAPNAASGLSREASMTRHAAASASASAIRKPALRDAISRNGVDSTHQSPDRQIGGVCRRQLSGDRSAGEDDDAVGQRSNLVEIVRDQQHGGAVVA